MKGYSVRIPQGRYTVTAKIDTGPLFGIVTHEKEVFID